jgi:prepilin-type N-terminal cleavage/methylation domain-containing protein
MTSERGFTLIEVLLAAFLMTVGLVGLLSVVPVGTFATTDGYRLSTATFLANQKLEEVRNMPWRSAPANDCLGLSAGNPPAAPTVPGGATCTLPTSPQTVINANGALPWFADQGSTAISGFSGYSRSVRITNCGVGAGCGGVIDATLRNVVVTVTYRSGTAVAVSSTDKAVTVSMLVTQR